MKSLFTIFILCMLNQYSLAACGPFFGKFFKQTQQGLADTPEYKYRARQKKLEDQANTFRTRRDNPEPAQNIRIIEKIEKMNVFIFNNINAPNERMWRTFFREFEADFISFERLSKLLQKLPDEFTKTELKKVISTTQLKLPKVYQEFILRLFETKESSKALRSALSFERAQLIPKLANNYQEYRLVRGNLEGLLKRSDCTDICKNQVNILLGRIGTDSKKEQLINHVFFTDEVRPKLEQMRVLLYSEQDFLLTKLKRERNAEFFRFFKSFITQPIFIDTLFGYIYKNPALKNSPKVNFIFREIYNSHARNSHFPKISNIINSPDNQSQSLDLLKRLNASETKDELLITFARRVDSLANSKWKKLLEYAKSSEPAFAERMEQAVEVAQKRGEMSPTDKQSFVGRLAAAIVVGVPAFSYFYFDIKPGELMEVIYADSEEDSDGATTTEIIEPNNSEEVTNTDLQEFPLPDRGEPILTEGEDDDTLEVAIEAIIEATELLERNPSSTNQRPLFSNLWCSLFRCSKK